MENLATALRYEMLILLIALIGLIAFQMATNKINVKGLLMDKTGGHALSAGRLQMLIVTLGIALYYILMVLDSKETGKLPDMPNEYLLALGGSHSVYLGGKFYGMLASKFGFASPFMRERAKPENGG